MTKKISGSRSDDESVDSLSEEEEVVEEEQPTPAPTTESMGLLAMMLEPSYPFVDHNYALPPGMPLHKKAFYVVENSDGDSAGEGADGDGHAIRHLETEGTPMVSREITYSENDSEFIHSEFKNVFSLYLLVYIFVTKNA